MFGLDACVRTINVDIRFAEPRLCHSRLQSIKGSLEKYPTRLPVMLNHLQVLFNIYLVTWKYRPWAHHYELWTYCVVEPLKPEQCLSDNYHKCGGIQKESIVL